MNSMVELAKTVAGAMVISVGDHPEMRRIHEGLHMKSLAINYTVGGSKGAAAQELLIWNENTHAGRRSQGTLNLF